MTDQEEFEATLRCTRCGHSVPPPAESTSDETFSFVRPAERISDHGAMRKRR